MTKSVQGKAESANWRKQATLRDLLDLLDDIENIDKHPEEKAKLRQRVIDYGQHLSEQIFLGKKEVPATDDNQTIKEFNNRFYSTYDTKSESSYEEAKLPKGYYDKEGKFISVPSTKLQKGHVGAINPRWHPIPLRDETPPPPPPPPFDWTHTNGGNGGKTGSDDIVPPVNPIHSGGRTGGGGTGGNSGGENIAGESTSSNDKNKRRIRPWWLVPLVLGTAAVTFRQCSAGEAIPPADNNENKDTTEVVTKVYTPTEKEFLRYTIEKGQRMTAKQFGVSVEEGAEIYNQFVENIRNGNIPETMKDLTKTYQMSKMVDKDLGINLDDPAIAATSWMVMGESYDASRKTIHNAITNPEQEPNSAAEMRLQKSLSMANAAAKKHNANEDSNRVVTIDYGLYGATKQTGWAISFKNTKGDKAAYKSIVDNALDKGQGY